MPTRRIVRGFIAALAESVIVNNVRHRSSSTRTSAAAITHQTSMQLAKLSAVSRNADAEAFSAIDDAIIMYESAVGKITYHHHHHHQHCQLAAAATTALRK